MSTHQNERPRPSSDPDEASGGTTPTAPGVEPVPGIHPALAAPPVTARVRAGLDRFVFGVAAAVALAFCLWGILAPANLGGVSGSALQWVVTNLGWFFIILATGFVIFVLVLAGSRYGRIPLGRDDEAPEFGTASWIAMMFSAGMGIGLMFYGVNEPLTHFVTPPPGTVEGSSDAAVRTAMATTMFHWSLHPWAIYAVVGIAIAYGCFRRGRRQLFSSAFAPLFGQRRAEGKAGRVIDVLAIFATLFGSATSLGLGALQIGSGITILTGVGELGNGILIGVIAVLTAAFVASAVSGVARGIQYLSNINMVLALLLALFVFVGGPTVFILNIIPNAIGAYFSDLALMAGRTGAAGGDATAEWLGGWTVFYWAWWISWTPFVGVFIARISRGRTIRQFVTGVLLVPSAVSLVWFAVFGGAAIAAQRGGDDLASEATAEAQLFGMLADYPLSTVTTVLVVVLVSIFFVSGADAASVVMGTLSERGSLNPSRFTVVFWGVLTGVVAAIMLAVGEDALEGLKNLVIVAALPFSVVMVLLCVSLVKDLRRDPMMLRRDAASLAVEQAVVEGLTKHGDEFTLVVGTNGEDEPEAVVDQERPRNSPTTWPLPTERR
ncbi:BCCT family transporter [Auraticoccus monumenti]|uniref:Choline/carnitine/betaine transport n=1 Tax=Auraticoccus monumenti TaxID=675864 RepID=A0A1G6ZMF4_9ACTN|nr:BCCT family transporter [Auraticoccus monumenti]SDE03613.1 choline/carnitine/betaine transport [Auraticoccus monumenti]